MRKLAPTCSVPLVWSNTYPTSLETWKLKTLIEMITRYRYSIGTITGILSHVHIRSIVLSSDWWLQYWLFLASASYLNNWNEVHSFCHDFGQVDCGDIGLPPRAKSQIPLLPRLLACQPLFHSSFFWSQDTTTTSYTYKTTTGWFTSDSHSLANDSVTSSGYDIISLGGSAQKHCQKCSFLQIFFLNNFFFFNF